MRIRVSQKAFLVFATITAFTVFLAFLVETELTEMDRGRKATATIIDFRLSIAHLDALKHSYFHHHGPLERASVQAEFDRVRNLVPRILASGQIQNGAVASQLKILPERVAAYEKAYDELTGLYEKGREFLRVADLGIGSLRDKSSGTSAETSSFVAEALDDLEFLVRQDFAERHPEWIVRIKKVGDKLRETTHNPAFLKLVDSLVLSAEASYVDSLAQEDRELFLRETSEVFNEITTAVAATIEQNIGHRQQLLSLYIRVVLFAAILVMVMMWIETSRYIRRGLGNLNEGMSAIRERNYEFELPRVSADEVGDATVFLRDVARVLKEQFAEIQRGEAFLQRIIDGIGEPIMVIDSGYNVTLMNGAAVGLAGVKQGETSAPKCHVLSHGSDRPCGGGEHPCPMLLAQETGDVVTVEHVHTDTEGKARNVEIMASPLFAADGSFEGIIEASRDVTARKKLEDDLRHAQRMEAVGRLTGGVAHDFNNLLTPIVGYGEILHSALREGDPLRNYVGHILDAGKRAANLSKSLLAYSRKQTLDTEPTDINGVIRDIEKLLSRVIGEDIRIVLELAPVPLVINADSGQIGQVLMNLATNARDAMPDGGTFLVQTEPFLMSVEFAEAHEFKAPGEYVLVTVSDTGIGMERSVRDRVFDPYFSTKELGRGTGLGLSVVQGIIKQHGGSISIYSEVGQGTTFRIYFPLLGATPAKSTDMYATTSVQGGDETILVAEDDESVRGFVVDVLGQAGYRIIKAVDGEDAVRQYNEHRDQVDLLLLDVVMPNRTGPEAYEEINRLEPRARTIFMSGYPADLLEKKGIAAGTRNYLSKPISPISLLEKVREVLDR